MDDKWNRLTAFIGALNPHSYSHTGIIPTADPENGSPSPACEACRRLDITQELARMGDWEYEVATGNITWSRQIFSLLGNPPRSGQMSFEEYLFFYSPDDSERLQKTMEKTIRDNERYEIEVTATFLNGEHARHRCVFVPITDRNGAVIRINGYLQELACLKTLIAAEPEQKQEVRCIAVTTSDVVFHVSLRDNAFKFISPAVLAVTGRTTREWYRNPRLIREIMHPGWRGKFDREFKKVLCGKAEGTHVFPILHTSGETRWIQLRTTILRSPESELLAIEGIASDITDWKRQEGERKRLIRHLRKALAEVKTLSGLLPICSHCKKVRDDQGYWQQIDAFITEHSDLFFSHGLCPECLEQHYPEYVIRRSSGS
jgi:PAS domain S-box-containing protein